MKQDNSSVCPSSKSSEIASALSDGMSQGTLSVNNDKFYYTSNIHGYINVHVVVQVKIGIEGSAIYKQLDY